MYFDPRDPRDEPLQPTPDELDAWVSREHKRRHAWLAGPTEAEKDDWARRYRRRAALGFAETSLGPSQDEVAEWAEREHKRRQGWLGGPTDEEKRDWARRHERRGLDVVSEPELSPTEEDVDAWAHHERRRRQAWLDGPTEAEKQRWIRRETAVFGEGMPRASMMDIDLLDTADRLLRDMDLVAKGSLAALIHAPAAVWSYLVRSGRHFEEEFYQPPRRRRVRL